MLTFVGLVKKIFFNNLIFWIFFFEISDMKIENISKIFFIYLYIFFRWQL